MNRAELAKEFIPVATSILEKTGSNFKAKLLGIEEYNTSYLSQAIIKLAFILADEFLKENAR